jgi:hypothetical protein
MKIGMICGRFQPIHLGHLAVINAALSGIYFLPQYFRRKYITGAACIIRRTACIMVLHSKTASLPNGRFLPFCYKQNFPFPKKPANCTNFLFSPTFACIRTLSCYNGFCRPLGEHNLKGNQEKCLKNASSSPRTAPP